MALRLAHLPPILSIIPADQGIRTPPRNCSSAMISGTVGRVSVPESPSFGTPPVEFGYTTCRIRVRRSAFWVHFGGNGDPFSGTRTCCVAFCGPGRVLPSRKPCDTDRPMMVHLSAPPADHGTIGRDGRHPTADFISSNGRSYLSELASVVIRKNATRLRLRGRHATRLG